jgi:DNA mismatch repair protein MutH
MERPELYDPTSPESIEAYAKRLVGRSLRATSELHADHVSDDANRGSFGVMIEELYFGLTRNAESRPDFEEAGVELKTSPLIRGKRNSLRVKERLVLTMIDYMNVIDQRSYDSSTLRAKCGLLLIMYYLWEKGCDPLDYVIQLASLWSPPDEDLDIIRSDWSKIVEKVREGRAHELSGRDTMYLEAATKAATGRSRRKQPRSSELAKPRAFAFKSSYMTSLFERGFLMHTEPIPRDGGDRKADLETLVKCRLAKFVGRDERTLKRELGVSYSETSKHAYHLLAMAMLGVRRKRAAEFEKAGVKVKTIRLEDTGRIREHMSFRQIQFMDIVEEGEWEASPWHEELDRPFLLVVFQKRGERVIFKGGSFWRMPYADMESLEEVWRDTRDRVARGDFEDFIGARQHEIGHVRPKGRDSMDLMLAPDGTMQKKKAFWLNKEYILAQLEELGIA